jgi:adenylate cyclase
MVVGGVPQLLTLVPIAEGRAQGWRVGVVVPEGAYVGGLAAERDRLLALLAVVVAAIAAVGVLGARTVGRGVSALVRSTEAMHRFSFAAAATTSPFAEVRGALQSVERAKTALRAMVKYVPVGLVRRLYESGREPVLGAELTEVSLMFTDIANFTTHAESLPPARLAQALGRYLETATHAVEQAGGTVDKYIGDALMVIWNAPDPVVEHARAACRGALACAAATDALGVSDWWRGRGLPPWRTRFGLHTDSVLVGHFGAPDRLSYTAMGDGVNLAARLEGLNKAYGTTILVSEEMRAAAGAQFVFRQVDRVAVKGKTRGGAVYELVGTAGDPSVEAKRPTIARYEEALAAAFDRHFNRALELCETLGDDGPAKVLATRCKTWIASPPPEGWDGTWAAREK